MHFDRTEISFIPLGCRNRQARERETGVQFDAMPVWRRVSRHTQHTLCCECQCGMRVQSPLHACAPCRVFFMIFGFGFGVEAKTKQQPLNERSVSHTSCACGAKSAAGRRQKAKGKYDFYRIENVTGCCVCMCRNVETKTSTICYEFRIKIITIIVRLM